LILRLAGFGVVLLGATSCGPGQVTPEHLCKRPAGTARPLSASQLAELAGRYDVALVNSEGEYGDSVVRGTLVLWASDSARRFMPRTIGRIPGERPLTGTFESHSTTVSSYPNRYDPGGPDGPAVAIIGSTLYLGGVDGTDAVGERLVVEELTPTGFAGAWGHSGGFSVSVDTATGRVVREPSGYFCAWRAPQA
jgi:hypothetical protein